MEISTFQSKLDFIKNLYSNKEWTEKECQDDILAALKVAHRKIEIAYDRKSLCHFADRNKIINIATFQSELEFVKELYFDKQRTDKECRDDILAALEEAHTKIVNAFGESLCRLKLGRHKPSIETVEKVVKKFPSALLYEDEFVGNYPPLTISNHNYDGCGFEYIPVLAKEGVKHNVGGEDGRGGLLSTRTSVGDLSTFQFICFSHNDTVNLNVLKELRKMGLFVKSDIQKYKLLKETVKARGEKTFEYLTDWDPDALLNIDVRGVNNYFVAFDFLGPLLKAGFKHFPNIGGTIFFEDTFGNTVLDSGLNGLERTISALHKVLAPRSDYPILHHVYIKAPQYVNSFAPRFHWAYHLKDHNNRTLHQAVLAAGPDIMNANGQLFASLTDDQLQTKDPITTLYPFAAMAVGEHADLEKSFYLLRRHPSVFEERLHE